MLANLNRQLKDSDTGPATKFHKQTANRILEGLGLSVEEQRALRARLSQVGVGGTVHGTGTGAFGLSAAGSQIVIHHTTELDGRVVERSTTKHQQRRKRRNPTQKRGPQAA